MSINDKLIVSFGLKDSSRMVNKNDEGSHFIARKKFQQNLRKHAHMTSI